MTVYNGPTELINLTISAFVVFSVTVLYTRLIGLRSFAKMSSTDFATTIAIGSMIASVILPSSISLIGGCYGIFMVYLLQWLTSWLKTRSKAFSSLIGNSPAIIMRNGQIDLQQLSKVNMSRNDLIAKLREANVFELSEVKCAVLETTGDVSILHGDKEPSPDLLPDN